MCVLVVWHDTKEEVEEAIEIDPVMPRGGRVLVRMSYRVILRSEKILSLFRLVGAATRRDGFQPRV